MSFQMDRDGGPFLDPYFSVNPCCCCCGVIPIVNGVKTVATISMIIAASYLVMGCWFAFNALMIDDQPFLGTDINIKPKLAPVNAEETEINQPENLMNILLICGLTSLIGGTFRFLTSMYLLKSAEKESKTPAKLWCATTFGMVMIVTAVVLAVSQKDIIVFNSLTMDIFLCLAGVDFILLLYFLWVIIVFVKEEIDMPSL